MDEHISLRRYQQAALVAAGALEDLFAVPVSSHRRVLTNMKIDAVPFGAITGNHNYAQLAPDEIAVMEFAETLITQSRQVTRTDIDHLKTFGLSNAEILEIATIAVNHTCFSEMGDWLPTP